MRYARMSDLWFDIPKSGRQAKEDAQRQLETRSNTTRTWRHCRRAGDDDIDHQKIYTAYLFAVLLRIKINLCTTSSHVLFYSTFR